jgi:hypothetical protein
MLMLILTRMIFFFFCLLGYFWKKGIERQRARWGWITTPHEYLNMKCLIKLPLVLNSTHKKRAKPSCISQRQVTINGVLRPCSQHM